MRIHCVVLSFRSILIVLFVIYVFYGGISIYYMLKWYIPDTRLNHIAFQPAENRQRRGSNEQEVKINQLSNRTVEIWGKAAIGHYLWSHILEGSLEDRLGGVWTYGFKHIHGINFNFRTGPGVLQGKVPEYVENLVLVINGREPGKVKFAEGWLDYIVNLPSLRRVAVVLLGNERCDNGWIKERLRSHGGVIDVLMVVYDDPDVDDNVVYQWPLGVATYRGFPVIDQASIPATRPRRYLCNFLGTVYADSSRETMLSVIRNQGLGRLCYVQARNDWLPEETEDSREEYIKILSDSDLTLNPTGKNTECYRIYEAMSLGSIPVVEDVMTDGHCGTDREVALRLLKKHNAPVEYITNFNDLPHIIEKYQKMPLEELVKKREKVLLWYIKFKESLRDHFVGIIKKKFF